MRALDANVISVISFKHVYYTQHGSAIKDQGVYILCDGCLVTSGNFYKSIETTLV